MKERHGPRMPLAPLRTFKETAPPENANDTLVAGSIAEIVGTGAPPLSEGPVLITGMATEPNNSPQDESQILEIPVAEVDRSPYQPRIKFAPEEIDALAATIQSEGPLVAITVRRKSNGRYELVAGERRLRAHQILGKETIRAVTVEGLSDFDAAIAALADNEARVDLCDYERGKAFRRILDMPRVEGGPRMTQVLLAARIGRSEATISRCLNYFNLPKEILDLLDDQPDLIGGKNAGILVGICKSGHDALAVKAVKRIKEEGMSEQGAVNWALGEANRAGKFPVPPVHFKFKGKHIADIATDGSKVIVTCKNGFTPAEMLELMNKLESTLQA